jgi:hypothetical protein
LETLEGGAMVGISWSTMQKSAVTADTRDQL